MHLSYWVAGDRAGLPREKRPLWIWFFRWGFGVWIGRRHFSAGHDTRGRQVSVQGRP